MEACCVAGPAELYAGKLVAAQALLDCGLALYRPERHRDHAGRYGQDPLVALAFIARVHALLGRPDLARQRASAILIQQDSEPAPQPNSAAALHARMANCHLVPRDASPARSHAETLIAVASEHGLPLWLGLGRMYRGAALVESGMAAGDRSQLAERAAEGRAGLTLYRSTGAGLDVATCLCWLATGLIWLGDAIAANQLLEEARSVAAATGQSYFTAELQRLGGELALVTHGQDAEFQLWTALLTARRQRANLFALRSAVSLRRLWIRHGWRTRARELLTDLCQLFPAGAECRDLTEARTLLATAA
jgi:predicted ATPase